MEELCMCTHVDMCMCVYVYICMCACQYFSGVDMDFHALVYGSTCACTCVCACVSMSEYIFHQKPDIALLN